MHLEANPDNEDLIKASIVTVVYNNCSGMQHFLECYEKLVDRSDLELVVIDGGSTDGTRELVESRAELVDIFIYEKYEGIYDAMNKGIGSSRGEYVILINSDDWVIPENFDAALDQLHTTQAEILAGGARMTRGGEFAFNHWPRHIDMSIYMRTIPFSHNSIFIARSLYERLGLYRTDLKIVSDLEFYYRVAEGGAAVETFEELIIGSELAGLSGQDNQTLHSENVKILQERFPFLSWSEAEALVEFRKALANADKDFNLQKLFKPIAIAAENGVNLLEMCKIAVDAQPTNLLGECFDLLLAQLPRAPGRTPNVEQVSGNHDDDVLLTIGVPTFNCEETIRRTLDSLCAQTLPNTEIVVFDDASTDGTLDLLRSLNIDNMRIFRSPYNIGVTAIRNRIADEARGEYIMFCDDDDVSHPDRAARCMEKLRGVERQTGRPGEVVCFTTREFVTVKKNRIRVEAAGSDVPLMDDDLRTVILANLARVAGQTGTLGTLDISVPRAVGSGVGLYPTALLRELCFHETFRRLGDLEFCMAAADRIVVTGVKETLYTQYMTLSQDKGSDYTAAFSVLLLRLYYYSFAALGLDPDILICNYIDMARPPVKNSLQAIRRTPPWPSVTTLCTWDWGGAGLGSHRRIEALRRRGQDNILYCLFKKTNKTYVRRFPLEANGETVENRQHYWQENAIVPEHPTRGHHARELFSTTWSMIDFRQHEAHLKAADILHLHWVVGMLDYENVGEVLADQPIVWTLADMNAFTGGCHYSEGCEGFKNECRDCPLLGPEASELAHNGWKVKKQAYDKLKNLHIICPSQWLADQARASSLLGDRPIHMIPNALPVDRFIPTNKIIARERLGLPWDKKLVGFGADSLKNRRKGGDILQAAIENLKASGHADNVECVFFGNNRLELGIPVHNLGHVADEAKMSLVYAAADVFAFPSREGNAPLTVAESLLSGTPVVGFPVGNVPEIVRHRATGYIATYDDAEDFAEGLLWALEDWQVETARMRGLKGCIEARAHNDPDAAAARHIALYKKVLECSTHGSAIGVKT